MSQPIEKDEPETKKVKEQEQHQYPARERNSTVRFIPKVITAVKEFKIKVGKGKKLGSIENIEALLKRTNIHDKVLEEAHRVAFGIKGRANRRKTNLRKFSGIVDENEENIAQRISKIKPRILVKEVARLFDCVVPAGCKVEDELLKFLLEPKESGKPLSSLKKKWKPKSKAKKQKKKTQNKGPKKPMNAFSFFMQEAKSIVQKKHPDYSITEIVKKCTDKWKKLDNEQKKPFEKKAQKERERYELEKTKKEKKSKTRSIDFSDSSDTDSSDGLDEILPKKRKKESKKDYENKKRKVEKEKAEKSEVTKNIENEGEQQNNSNESKEN